MFGAGLVAYTNGRGMLRWILAAYIFSWFAVLIVLFLPKNIAKMHKRVQTFKAFVEDYAMLKVFKDVSNVDDLMKQLETK
jgi:hypothetical protein